MSFYDTFVRECKRKGVSPSKAASDCGINRSNVTNWKNNGYTPRGDALQRIADYFGVSTDYLLGTETEKAPADNGKRVLDDDYIKFALFGDGDDITDAMYEEVKNFAKFVRQREATKKE